MTKENVVAYIHEDKKFMETYYGFLISFKKIEEAGHDESKVRRESALLLKSLLSMAINKKGTIDYLNWIRWNSDFILLVWADPLRVVEKLVEKKVDETTSDGNVITRTEKVYETDRDLLRELDDLFSQIRVVASENPEINSSDHDNTRDIVSIHNEFEQIMAILVKKEDIIKKIGEHAKSYFLSLLNSLIDSKNSKFYEQYKEGLFKNKELLASFYKKFGFNNFAMEVENFWSEFSKKAETVFKSDEQFRLLQEKRIHLALEKVNQEMRANFLQQIIRKIGEFYNQVKDALEQIKTDAFNVTKIIANPILHPIETAKNVLYAVTNPKETLKQAFQWMWENPGKTILIVLGVGIGAALIGAVAGVVISALVGAGGIASITVSDVVIGGVVGLAVGGIAATGAIATAGAAAHKQSLLHVNKQIEDELSRRARLLKDSQDEKDAALEAIRKVREDKIKGEKATVSADKKTQSQAQEEQSPSFVSRQDLEKVKRDLEESRSVASDEVVSIERTQMLLGRSIKAISEEEQRLLQNRSPLASHGLFGTSLPNPREKMMEEYLDDANYLLAHLKNNSKTEAIQLEKAIQTKNVCQIIDILEQFSDVMDARSSSFCTIS